MTRELELIGELREAWTSDECNELLDELEGLVKQEVLWPVEVRVAAVEAFGGAIHNVNGQVHQQLDRRIRHAMRVWKQRYGGLNPAQLEYAGTVLAFAISSAASEAPTRSDRYAYAYTRLEQMIREEVVHEGMKKRAGLVDVSAQLAEYHAGEVGRSAWGQVA
jgi:hypothetical protein